MGMESRKGQMLVLAASARLSVATATSQLRSFVRRGRRTRGGFTRSCHRDTEFSSPGSRPCDLIAEAQAGLHTVSSSNRPRARLGSSTGTTGNRKGRTCSWEVWKCGLIMSSPGLHS